MSTVDGVVEGHVVMPFYLVVNVSASVNADIDSLNAAIASLLRQLSAEPILEDLVMLSVITFDDEARSAMPLTTPNEAVLPLLRAGGGRVYGAAIREFHRAFESDRQRLRKENKRVYRPCVLFLADGDPDDTDYLQVFQDLLGYDPVSRVGNAAYPYVAAFGYRDASQQVMSSIAYPNWGPQDQRGRWFIAKQGATVGDMISSMAGMLGRSVLGSAQRASAVPQIAPPQPARTAVESRPTSVPTLTKADLLPLTEFGTGGMATVYRVSAAVPGLPPLAYKELLPTIDRKVRDAALAAMRTAVAFRDRMSPAERADLDAVTAWPLAMVADGRDEVGCVMPLIPQDFFISASGPDGAPTRFLFELQFLNAADGYLKSRGMTRGAADQDLIRLALMARLAYAIELIHRPRGGVRMVYGDLSLKNGAVALNPPRVMLMDCDGIADVNDPTRIQLHSPFFVPPEITSRQQRLQDQATDVYKLALCVVRGLARGSGTTQLADPRSPLMIDGLLDQAGIHLLERALSPDRASRPTAETIKNYLVGRVHAMANLPVGAAPAPRRPGTVFISYRRQDAPSAAGRISDRLAGEFGSDSVFIDVDKVAMGADIAAVIRDEIASTGIVLAIIGPQWLSELDQHREADDWVRFEIEQAYRQGVPVLPVLVDGARMPAGSSLPASIRALASANAPSVRHETFGVDIRKVVSHIRSVLSADPGQ